MLPLACDSESSAARAGTACLGSPSQMRSHQSSETLTHVIYLNLPLVSLVWNALSA